MPDIIKILWAIIAALVFLTLCFGVAVIVSPDFRDSAATAALIAAILGPLTTAASILGGFAVSRGIKGAVQEEVGNEVGNEAPNGGDGNV